MGTIFRVKAVHILISPLLTVCLGTTAFKKGIGGWLRMLEGKRKKKQFRALGGVESNLFARVGTPDLVPSFKVFLQSATGPLKILQLRPHQGL